ncbi:helix-turn-helix domain-containing protein [Sediminitomix flava]|uniref:AraC family transcriptional regulator n=1 Tax=Sediminitomix flava TaxID=379075 RepID=A0A315ZG50_SEDFL|nr:AraC family transcriptional regulator [Sediminitomix flava]PWJ43724.1 AraC family transcriptional regulator [Sediminitomix flava]
MEHPKASSKGKVFLSGTTDKEYTWETISPQHIIVFIYSGELILTYGKNTLTFVPGDTVLIPKNQLTRSLKKPADGKPFKCVSLFLTDENLRDFYLNKPVSEDWIENISKQRPINPHPLLESFFGTLLPYFDMEDELPEALVPIKITEALTIIDTVDKRASKILGTFSEIGKVDLEAYMEEHYMYNLPLERFAFLTGRSLTTFKSDFKKIFQNTPGKWLTEKRLDLAHHKLNVEKQKTSDVYLSVGFENLSHFSFAFKKAFGYSPSSLNSNQQLRG